MQDSARETTGRGNLGTIVVAGHPYADYTRIISGAFSKLGYEAICIEYKIPKLNSVERLSLRLSTSFRLEFYREMTARNSIQIEEAVIRHKPDFVLVMNGNDLTKTTINLCKSRNTRLAMWAYDSYRNFTWIGDVAGKYDLVFTYEPQDLEAFSTKRPIIYLPMAFDPDIYFPTDSKARKEFDVVFAGAVRGNYPERTRRLRALGAAHPDRRIQVIAPGTPFYSPFRLHDVLITISGNRTAVRRGWCDHAVLNSMYNKARICVNIHSSQSDSAVNPRSFEILGSGGLLLTDRPFPHVSDLLPGQEYFLYDDDADMLEKVEWLLDNPSDAKSIAIRGHQAALAKHTYLCRARRISEMLNRIDP